MNPLSRWAAGIGWSVVLVLTITASGAQLRQPPSAPVGLSPGTVRSVASRSMAPAQRRVGIRIGLATDVAEFVLPCCQKGVSVAMGGEVVSLGHSLRVVGAAASSRTFYRLQAAALEGPVQAEALARRLERSTGAAADSFFDAGAGLYRVRVGSFDSRPEAEAFKSRFAKHGLTEAWIVREGSLLGEPALAVSIGLEERVIAGRWLRLATSESSGLRIAGGRYRGSILLYLNDRGLLNLINELSLESYLRGVVPLEMGPELYSSLESLKAQAIAARTYAARNRGEFEVEGYDLCPTPRCQVYGGVDVEHPLSDRAVAETRDQVLVYKGRLADTLYSSSCGGHTEDVSVMFPQKAEAYLRGVPCVEAPHESLASSLPRGTPLQTGLLERLFPSLPERSSVATVEAALRRMVELADVTASTDRLRSLERGEIRRFLASIFDLVIDPRLFRDPLSSFEPGWNSRELRLRALLKNDSSATPPRPAEIDSILLGLAAVLGITQDTRGYFLGLFGDRLDLRVGGSIRRVPLPKDLATYRPRAGGVVSADVDLAIGDRIWLIRHRDRLLGLVQEHDAEEIAATVDSTSWSLFRSDVGLRSTVAKRHPGFRLRDFEVLERGISGRVGRLRLNGDTGESFVLEGLAVRWALGVPDNHFTAQRSEARGGWVFRGRGRGHGVGMCQIGAYLMSLRGHGYSEILAHYYTGIGVGRLRG